MYIDFKIQELKSDLLREKLSYEQVFQKHVIQGDNFYFNHFKRNATEEFRTKELVANALGIHMHEVIIVGSAKLGYSLNPNNLFNHFDSKYNLTQINRDKSDIDIAIISPELFEKVSKSIFDYTDSFKSKWKQNEYYFGDKLLTFGVPICYKYFEYFSRGWFRPDMKPQGYDFCQNDTYEKLNNKLYSSHKRKVRLAIYKDWFYFKSYHINNIKTLLFRIKTEII